MKITSWDALIAFLIWAVGAWATVLFCQEIGIPSAGYADFFVGTLVQVILSYCQHKLIMGPRSALMIGIFALLVLLDVLLNHGGLYPYFTRVTETSAYQNLGLPPSPGEWVGVVFSLILCTIIAIMPEVVYRGG